MKTLKLFTARVLVGVVLAGGAAVACGGAQETTETAGQKQDEEKAARLLARARETKDADRYRTLITRFSETKAAADARDELAAILIKQAEAALAQKNWSDADDLAEEARTYAGLDLTRKAVAIEDQLDKARAAVLADKAGGLAKDGKCASALKTIAVPLRQKPRDTFKQEVQKLAGPALVACLAKKLAGEVDQGNLDPARAMIETPDATAALSKKYYDDAHTALLKLVVKRSTSEIQPLLAAGKWTDAIAKLDELNKAGKLSDKEHEVAFSIVQDAIHDVLMKVAKDGLTADKPSKAMERIDGDVKIAAWKQLPDDLEAVRDLLSIAVECERLHCKPAGPEKVWAWGAVSVHPADAAEGEEKAKIKHAQAVWILARGKKDVLVALKDPGKPSGGDVWAKADGWADPDHLEKSDTDAWLPPDDQLVGVQVWGPLRAPSKDYHLGIVTKVEGKKITVKRMADSLETTVSLSSIRLGKLDKGLKIMAFCEDELHPSSAKVDSVVTTEGGVPKVKIACDKGGITRVDLGGSISSRVDWLPPRKP